MQSCWFSFCNKWRNLKSLNCVVEFGKTWLNCIMTTSTVPKMKTNEATCHPQLQHSSYDVAMFCKSTVEKHWLHFDIAKTFIRWNMLRRRQKASMLGAWRHKRLSNERSSCFERAWRSKPRMPSLCSSSRSVSTFCFSLWRSSLMASSSLS